MPYYATVLLVIETAVMLMTMTLALVLASASWPSPAMLAAREPAVKNLQTGATVLRVATFALVLGAVGPAVTALRAARDAAAEQAMWNALADQVVLTFPAVAGGAFEDVMPGVGRIVQDAERRGALALSYVLTRDALGLDGQDIAPYRYLVLVNRRWLDLMWSHRSGTGVEGEGAGTTEGLVRLSPGQVPADARAFLEAGLPVWMRHPAGWDPFTDGMTFYRYEGTRRLPFVRIGGELVFPAAGEALIVLVPEVHRLFNDSFLTSLASSRNLLFTGLEPTRDLVAQYGLEDRIQVRYSAEEGILRAQFTAYFAALRAGSLVALAVALAVSTGIGAFITAVLNARRDFVLRLAGQSWWTVVRPRVVREGLAGVVLSVLVMLVQAARNPDLGSSFSDAGYAAAAAATAILALPWFHRAAARWVFIRVGLRRL
ncbi:hypothetical protein [Thermaerobacter marianensis]|uniref:hypothetical protein n=1 Tax=Thermaerobacter marianensis TaxID=73919 RepID=UPI001A99AFAD|nr:hypothetical protein [Thermaerobacter marianensis]